MIARFYWLARHPALWAVAAALLLLVVGTQAADARVGGGQGFSGGGSSGGRSGRSSGGGGGGGEADILFLLIHLAIEFPCVGIPLLILFLAFLAYRAYAGSGGGRSVYENNEYGLPQTSTFRAPRTKRPNSKGMATLKEADGAFSVPVFLDFSGMVYRRALAATDNGGWDSLAPFVGDRVKGVLTQRYAGKRVRDVVVGGTRIERVTVAGSNAVLRVRFESNLTIDLDGKPQQFFLDSSWNFTRATDATSLPPDAAIALNCPSCGSPVETTSMGACTACDTPITKGQLQWQASGIEVHETKRVRAPEIGFFAGGDEPSTQRPTVMQPELTVQMRAFLGRHPDFDKSAFQNRVRTAYLELQGAWSDNRWDRARPFVTDTLYQQLRFWIENFTRHGLQNRLADVTLTSVKIVSIQEDAWYEAITVRIYGSMKDWTVDSDGKVVAGNAKKDRRFSEYWTFLRAAGTGASSPPEGQCPSCAAPLDNIGAAGVCGYCDSKITTGRFDWVLSRIDQVDAYRG